MSSGDISSVSPASTRSSAEAAEKVSGSEEELEEEHAASDVEGDEEEELEEEVLASTVGEEEEEEEAGDAEDDAAPLRAESHGSVIDVDSGSESDPHPTHRRPQGFLAAARAGHATQPVGSSSHPAGIHFDFTARPADATHGPETVEAPPPVVTEDASTNTSDAVTAATLDPHVAAAVASMSASAQARVPVPQLRALHDQHGEFVAEQTDVLLRLLGRPLAPLETAGVVPLTSTVPKSEIEPASPELVAAVEALRSAVAASLQRSGGAAPDQSTPGSAPPTVTDDAVATFFAGVSSAFTAAAHTLGAGPARVAPKAQPSDRYISFMEARCSALSSDLAKQRVRAEQAEASNLKMRNAKRFEQRLQHPATGSVAGDGASLVRGDERSAAEARHMTAVAAELRSQLAAALAEARSAKERVGVLEAQSQSAAAQPRGAEHLRERLLPQCLEPVFGWSAAVESDGTLRLSREGHDEVAVKIAVSADSVSVVEDTGTPMPVQLARAVLADYESAKMSEPVEGKRARDEGSDALAQPVPAQPAAEQPAGVLVPDQAQAQRGRSAPASTVTAQAVAVERTASESGAMDGAGAPEQSPAGDGLEEPVKEDGDEVAASCPESQSSQNGEGSDGDGGDTDVFGNSSVFV